MTLDDLTINISNYNPKDLIKDWRWLVGKRKIPVLVSVMGDMFLQDPKDGTIHFLSFVDGKITKIADSGDKFSDLLSDKNFVINYFPVQLIGDLKLAGNALEPENVYSFKIPPRLGGEFNLDNIEQCNCIVNSSLTAQIHKQLHDIPNGTKIEKIHIPSSKRPKWKFWG